MLHPHPLSRTGGNPKDPLFEAEVFASRVLPMRGRMLSIARGILRCQDLARDAVQETLIQLWGREEVPHDLDGWLRRMVALRALQLRRSLQRRRRNELDAEPHHGEHETCTDPLHQLLHEERGEEVRKALLELPEPLRDVVVLREWEGLDYVSIADTVRVPVGTVRSRLSRARRALADRIQLEGTEAGPPALGG